MRLTKKDTSAKMHVAVATISMSMFIQEQEHISVEKNQPLLRAWRESQADPD
jgi:hypothetical protein